MSDYDIDGMLVGVQTVSDLEADLQHVIDAIHAALQIPLERVDVSTFAERDPVYIEAGYTLESQASVWLTLEQAHAELGVIVRDLAQQVGNRLAETDYDPKQGYPLPDGNVIHHRQPAQRERWQGRQLLRDLSTPMVDADTGEMIPVIPLSVLTDIVPGVGTDEQTSSKWRTTGLKNLDVNPDDYRTREWGEPRAQKGPRRS